jgi:hypothetical protein
VLSTFAAGLLESEAPSRRYGRAQHTQRDPSKSRNGNALFEVSVTAAALRFFWETPIEE